MSDKLTIKEAEKLSEEFSSEVTKAHYKQLAYVMRENEQLKQELEYISFSSHCIPSIYNGEDIPEKYQHIIAEELKRLGSVAERILEVCK